MRPTAAAAPSCFRGRASRAEVARGLPTAVLAASADETAAAAVQEHFRGPGLRLYVTDDVAGCGDRWRAEERHRHRRGRRRGAGSRAQRSCRLDHARPRGNLAPGLRRRWAARNARGSQRSRRPGAHLHGGSEPESPGRHRARTRTIDRPRFCRACGWWPRAFARRARPWRSARNTASSCRSPTAMQAVLDGRCSPAEAVEALMLRRQRAEVDG